jgi:ketosteroid isomerase-like protein
MRAFTGLIGLAALALPMPALAQNAAVEAPIKAFADAFNKGDMVAAAALHDKSVTIVDEVAPYSWSGPNGFAGWLEALGKETSALGKTDEAVAFGAPTRELVEGAQAYAIVPVTYTYKQKGVAMVEKAQITFTLHRTASGWKISGWTWTGPDPSPVG